MTYVGQKGRSKIERNANRHDEQCYRFGARLEDWRQGLGRKVHDCH